MLAETIKDDLREEAEKIVRQKVMLTELEAAEDIGYSRMWVAQRRRRGLLAYIKVGARVMIPRTEIVRILSEGCE
jgi:hypothetical protein